MGHEDLLIVVDVGNTNTVCGVFAGDEILRDFRFSTDIDRTADEYASLLLPLLNAADLDPAQASGVIICSVVPPLNLTFELLSKRYFHQEPIFVEPGVKTAVLLVAFRSSNEHLELRLEVRRVVHLADDRERRPIALRSAPCEERSVMVDAADGLCGAGVRRLCRSRRRRWWRRRRGRHCGRCRSSRGRCREWHRARSRGTRGIAACAVAACCSKQSNREQDRGDGVALWWGDVGSGAVHWGSSSFDVLLPRCRCRVARPSPPCNEFVTMVAWRGRAQAGRVPAWRCRAT